MSVGASETACLRGSLCTSEAGSTTNRDRLYQGVVDDLDTLVRAVGLNVFLAEMAAVVPWGKLEALIEPHYPRLGPQGGRRPFPLSTMLRIYCLQQWYNLSDPSAEEALYDIQSMRAFAGLELGRDAIPDETTILNFRHLLERHEVTKAIFASVAEHLAARGELLRGGTIVDATLIAASPSTKNREQMRDPEMSSSKKGTCRFRKLHPPEWWPPAWFGNRCSDGENSLFFAENSLLDERLRRGGIWGSRS